eukprot:CAMPEP_0115831484 /NCGR_PEP_ID=MMETSP0287-20121206/2163_1 /TAXON_ID=412157 /ORGANISM="Chrysochromulina rotalis, Strain UIO044" /LENGTH=320 /DNA_ID=CAMNT_0003284833 /DNA_START=11 /DNA_END=973 /DNA_ORIENTATION=+
MSLAPDPRSQCERYSDETYARMRDDEQRTKAYENAITAVVVCVDIGTGALALLAVIAAKAGAKHVYAIEANAQAHAAAIETVARHGLADRITVLHGYSTDVVLPAPADLMIHEIIGEIAGAEGVVRAVQDAASRLLNPVARADATSGGKTPVVLSIPARARTMVAPAEFPGPDYFAALPFPMLAAPGATALKLPSLPRSLLLATPKACEDLHFEAATPLATHDVTLEFVLERAGTLRGLALHVELFMLDADALAPDISSADTNSHWPNVFLMLPEERQVDAGEPVAVRAMAQLGGAQPTYSFEVTIAGSLAGTMQYPDGV